MYALIKKYDSKNVEIVSYSNDTVYLLDLIRNGKEEVSQRRVFSLENLHKDDIRVLSKMPEFEDIWKYHHKIEIKENTISEIYYLVKIKEKAVKLDLKTYMYKFWKSPRSALS